MIENLVPSVALGFPDMWEDRLDAWPILVARPQQPQLGDMPQPGVRPSSRSAVLSLAAVSVHLF